MKAQFQDRFRKLWLAVFVVTELLGLWLFYGRWLWDRWVPHAG
jgi:hypothetical protein